MKSKLCFAVFTNLLYKQEMYIPSVSNIEAVLERIRGFSL